MLTVDSSVTTALESNNWAHALLVQIPGATTHYYTDHWKDILYGANTYSHDGNLVLNSGRSSRDLELRADAITIRLDNADKSLYEEYAAANQVGKEVILSVAFVNKATGNLLAANSVAELYKGIVDSWSQMDDGGTSSFSIRLTNHWGAFEIRKGRYTNTASQEEAYPGDTLFEFSFQKVLPTKWGL